jgi:dolichyl-phosphate beta-glucosyltransferase
MHALLVLHLGGAVPGTERALVRLMLRLSLVIPAYAEAEYLPRTLSELRRYLTAQGLLHSTEVIVVTANAPDETQALARRALRQFPNAHHLEPGAKIGKGRDVRHGMLAARGQVVLFMDADLATPLRHITRALAAIEAGGDVVIGCRALSRAHGVRSRSLASRLSNRLIRALLLPGLRDTQCGFKAFRQELVPELFGPLETMGWGFDFELLARARKLGHRIVELPIHDWADPKGDHGLAGEVQWWSHLRTLIELARVVARVGRQRERVAAQLAYNA